MSVLPKLIYTFNANLVKIPEMFFGSYKQIILKFMWRAMCPRIAKITFKMKKWEESAYLISRPVIYIATVIKTF